MATETVLTHRPRASAGTRQALMPIRYSLVVQLLSMAAFTLAFLGWLNETWLFWFDNPIWLNRYTEYAIILGFGLWRIVAEHNPWGCPGNGGVPGTPRKHASFTAGTAGRPGRRG